MDVDKRSRREKKRSPKQKKVNRRFILFSIILFVLAYFVVLRGIPFLITSNVSTVTAEKKSYTDEEEAKALLIRDEYVQKVKTDNLKFKVDSGEKVAKNQIIATARAKLGEEDREELDIYLDRISKYKELFDNYKYYLELEKIDKEELNSYIKKLKEDLEDKDQNKVDSIKTDLLNREDNNSEFFQKEIKILEERVDDLKKKSGNGVKKYRAKKSGILCQDTDSFEKSLKVKDVDEMNLEEFNDLVKDVEKSNIKTNKILDFFKGKKDKKEKEKSIKVVDNSYWYAWVETNINYKRYIDDRDYINFNMESKELKLPGKVIKVEEFEKENKLLILLRFEEGLYNSYDIRVADVKLERERYNGIEVPRSALTRKDEQNGVYIKDVNGIVRFVPVNIKYSDNLSAIINIEETGLIRATIDGKVVDRPALKIYDEVIKNGSLAKENIIIK
ncbi:MAG: HlyD family efflux transporter periplasmic adaptor subunit [Andreesenia angusta]|nr:HlyD family efflux transporter periplasmic adaptor subunit [Andreesenia angusta]